MSKVSFSKRLTANDIGGLILLPAFLFGIYGASRLATWLLPQLPALTLSEALYGALSLVLFGAFSLAALGKTLDTTLAQALTDEGLSGRERLAIAATSVTVHCALAAWPIGAALTSIVLDGYFNVTLAFVLVWSAAVGSLFPSCWEKAAPPQS